MKNSEPFFTYIKLCVRVCIMYIYIKCTDAHKHFFILKNCIDVAYEHEFDFRIKKIYPNVRIPLKQIFLSIKCLVFEKDKITR